MAYIDNNDGTITDTTTGLMWQAVTPEERMTWQEAIYYCASLDLAGRKDWRLPTVKELFSIVDYGKFEPACDPIFTARSGGYWSSTTGQDNPNYAWNVYFFYGGVDFDNKTDLYYVRAVRTAS